MCLKKNWLIMVMVIFVLLSGCTEKKQNKGQRKVPGNKIKKEKLVKAAAIPRVFVATKYSDSGWENGINKKNKSQFLITIDKAALRPIKIGSKLKFASCGDAVVKQISRQDTANYANIFITVDKNLDPVKDGNPNPIYLKCIDLQSCSYSKPGVWQNGIHLVQPGSFFFTIERMDQTPIKVGDRLKFAKAGEAKVIQVYRQDKEDKFANIFVKVDKSLDGKADGYPNTISVVITD